jgi:hypothetical protein
VLPSLAGPRSMFRSVPLRCKQRIRIKRAYKN